MCVHQVLIIMLLWTYFSYFLSPGRHVPAAEALKLGMLDRLTDDNTVDVAVTFAKSVEGKS